MKRRTLLKGIGTTGLVAGVGVAAGEEGVSTQSTCSPTCCESCDPSCDICDCETWCTDPK